MSESDSGAVHTTTYRLLDAARAGDRAASNELFARYYPIAMRMAARSMGAPGVWQSDVEDVVQDALHAAYHAISSFEYRHEGAFRQFLARIIRNRVIDRARRAGSRRERSGFGDSSWSVMEPEDEGTSPQDALRRQELLVRFNEWVELLSPMDRQIFDLRVVECRSTAEIAKQLDWNESSVRARMARVLAQLSDRLV